MLHYSTWSYISAPAGYRVFAVNKGHQLSIKHNSAAFDTAFYAFIQRSGCFRGNDLQVNFENKNKSDEYSYSKAG